MNYTNDTFSWTVDPLACDLGEPPAMHADIRDDVLPAARGARGGRVLWLLPVMSAVRNPGKLGHGA